MKFLKKLLDKSNIISLRIVLFYLIIGSLWILTSDFLFLFIFNKNAQLITYFSIVKGFLFVFVTTFLLYLVLNNDIKKIQKQNQIIKKNEEFLKIIIETLPNAILIIDKQKKVIFANSIAEKLLSLEKYENKQYKNFNLDLKDIKTEENINFDNLVFFETINTGKTIFDKEYLIINSNNEKIYLSITSTPFFNTETYEIIGSISSINDISQKIKFEENIISSLKEKDILIAEIHHRVKNNLQIMSSLVSLQSLSLKDEHSNNMLRDIQNRIKTMALIHEKLYQSKDFSKIDFEDYIKRLVRSVMQSYNNKRIKIDIHVKNISLPIDIAVPFGLIINELFTNCIKYAFCDREEGEIIINFSLKENKYFFYMKDNGCGLPPNFLIEKVETLGLKLVRTLVQQIFGQIEIKNNDGTEVIITFSL